MRESYFLQSSTVHQANGAPRENFPSISGLNQALGCGQGTEALQDSPGSATGAALGEEEGTGILAPSSAEGLEAGLGE